MRKFIKNQVTGKKRQIVHLNGRFDDRFSFSSNPLRCSRNDEYEYNQPRLNKYTYVCFKCALSARRRKIDFPATCPKCRKEMEWMGMRYRLPKKSKLKR